MIRPTTITLLALLAACSETGASASDDRTPTAARGISTDLIVRTESNIIIQRTDRHAIVYELVAPRTGFVFVHLRDHTLPRYEDWRSKVAGDPPQQKRSPHGFDDFRFPGEHPQSALSFHVLEEDVGRPIRLELIVERMSGERLLDEFVEPMYGERAAAAIRADNQHADAHIIWSMKYDVSFPSPDPLHPGPLGPMEWYRLALKGGFRHHEFRWQNDCAVPSGEWRRLGFEAFATNPDTVLALDLDAVLSGEDSGIAGLGDDPNSPQHGRCSVLELAWLADT